MAAPNIPPYHDDDDDNEDLLIQPEPVDLEVALEALRTSHNAVGALSKTIYYGLSGLDEAQLDKVITLWRTLVADYRYRVIAELIEANETNVELDYRAIGHMALRDDEEQVRSGAIELLWEDNSLYLMTTLMQIAINDASALVRASAVSNLGRFILGGELETLPLDETNKAQDLAVSIFYDENEDINVRRRALESLANSSNDTVTPAIWEAYNSGIRQFQVSSIFAMGKSYDEQWNDIVMEHLKGDDDEMRYEAARSAGELEIHAAVPALTELANGEDREIQEVAIYSLGEIGGNEVLRILNALLREVEEDGDEGLMEALEDAIASASIHSGALYLFDTDDDD